MNKIQPNWTTLLLIAMPTILGSLITVLTDYKGLGYLPEWGTSVLLFLLAVKKVYDESQRVTPPTAQALPSPDSPPPTSFWKRVWFE